MRCFRRGAGQGSSIRSRILSGAYTKDQGEFLFEGKPIEIRSPHHAQQLGISTIYQEFNLATHLTVPENIFLGHLPMRGPLVDWETAKAKSEEVHEILGVTLPMNVPVSELLCGRATTCGNRQVLSAAVSGAHHG